jgi:hypothetical protein
VGALPQLDPTLGRARVVSWLEEAQPDGSGVTGIHTHIGPTLDEGDPRVGSQVTPEGEGTDRGCTGRGDRSVQRGVLEG